MPLLTICLQWRFSRYKPVQASRHDLQFEEFPRANTHFVLAHKVRVFVGIPGVYRYNNLESSLLKTQIGACSSVCAVWVLEYLIRNDYLLLFDSLFCYLQQVL
eukprot:1418277-Amphidinium_carterae.4